MNRLLLLVLALSLLACSSKKEYIECKNPVEIKDKLYCEK